jgi:hypothetical protein
MMASGVRPQMRVDASIQEMKKVAEQSLKEEKCFSE